MDINDLEKSLRYNFKNQNLLIKALTRKDAVEKNQIDHDFGHQNTYATIGDAILTAIVVIQLYNTGRDTPEIITVEKNKIINRKALKKISQDLKVGKCMKMSNGEEKKGINSKPKPLAETLEAIIGAIYLDSDFETSMERVKSWKGFEGLTE